MAKFLVTSGSYFRPYSFEEYLKPISIAQQYHDQAQEAYDTLSEDTAELERYISAEGEDDAYARELYGNQMKRLQALQDELYNNGISRTTKKYLSEARAGYRRDIKRLASAIEARRKRGAMYEEMMLKDPSLIASANPGLDGLDNYLRDDMYGSNIYTYSGDKFMAEVAAEAKAVAGQRMSDPEAKKVPGLYGYLLTKYRDGFTEIEAANATQAVREFFKTGEKSVIENLDYGSALLAEVLLSNLHRTGAYNKVTPDMFDKLIGYGGVGLKVGGIGTVKSDLKEDVLASHALKKDLIKYQHELAEEYRNRQANEEGDGKNNKKGKEPNVGYALPKTNTKLKSTEYDTLYKMTGKNHEEFKNKKVYITNPDGTATEVFDGFEAGKLVYDSDARREGRKTLHGLDVSYIGKRQTVTFVDESGKERTLTTEKLTKDQARKLRLKSEDGVVVYENGKVNPDFTAQFNNLRQKHLEHQNSILDANKNNPDIKLAITPEEEFNIRKKFDISPTTPSSAIGHILYARAFYEDATPATLISPTGANSKVQRDLYWHIMQDSLAKLPKDKRGRHDANSGYGFYEIKSDGSVSDTPVMDINAVAKTPDEITSMSKYPRVDNSGRYDNVTQFRMTTSSGKTYIVNDIMLDQYTRAESRAGSGMTDVILFPIKNAEIYANMSQSERHGIANSIFNILHDFKEKNYDIDCPVVIDKQTGELRYANDKELLNNREVQQQLIDASTAITDMYLSNARDHMTNNPEQNKSASNSTNPPYFIPNILD